MRGFNGERLREAREARGLTGVSLAGLAGMSGVQVSQYEHGTRTPPAESVERLSIALNLPAAFFLQDGSDSADDLLVSFRSLSGATKTARTRELRRLAWVTRIAGYLRKYAALPAPNFPVWTISPRPGDLDEIQVDEWADSLREYWGVEPGPIPDVVDLLERNGAIVVRCELGADTLDAYSAWAHGVPYVVLAADKRAAVRSRFDAAHEIAHLVLHRQASGADLATPAFVKDIERQAHAFAGAFLMPADSFSAEFLSPTLDGFVAMKPRWQVSVGAMIKRASSLELIGPEQERRLWIGYRRRWGHREPFDDDFEAEVPKVLRSALEIALRSGVTPAALRLSLPYATADIEQLTGVHRGFLSSEDRAVGGNVVSNVLLFPSAHE